MLNPIILEKIEVLGANLLTIPTAENLERFVTIIEEQAKLTLDISTDREDLVTAGAYVKDFIDRSSSANPKLDILKKPPSNKLPRSLLEAVKVLPHLETSSGDELEEFVETSIKYLKAWNEKISRTAAYLVEVSENAELVGAVRKRYDDNLSIFLGEPVGNYEWVTYVISNNIEDPEIIIGSAIAAAESFRKLDISTRMGPAR